METLYSSWNPGEQYHLTTLSGGGTSSTNHQLNLTSSPSSSLSSSSPSSSSSSSSSPSASSTTIATLMATTSYLVGCDTPPTPVPCDSVMFNNHNNINGNLFYSPTSILDDPSTSMVNLNQGNNMDNINYDYQQQTIDNYTNDVVPSDYYNNNNTTNSLINGQSVFLSHHQTNYSIPTSMESPANTSYSSPSPSPDLWENYGLTESGKHLNQPTHCNLDQQQFNHHHQHLNHQQHHHHLQQQQNHSIVTNYHNQHSTAQQQVQHQNNLNNKSTFTINDNVITTANNNNNTTINIINNKDNCGNARNTINTINKSNNHRGSYRIKKSQIDSNLTKNESNGNHMNENFSRNHPKTSTSTHRHHHRSIESRGGLDKFLAPEDEERRRRRRERNKVAATKCRNKKKVHVYKLCQESQTLESTNCSLKEEMENLKREEQRLNEILVKHLPFCARRTLQPIQ